MGGQGAREERPYPGRRKILSTRLLMEPYSQRLENTVGKVLPVLSMSQNGFTTEKKEML